MKLSLTMRNLSLSMFVVAIVDRSVLAKQPAPFRHENGRRIRCDLRHCESDLH